MTRRRVRALGCFLRGAGGSAAIQWVSQSVRASKAALRAGFMTGLPRSARNDERSDCVEVRLSKCHSGLNSIRTRSTLANISRPRETGGRHFVEISGLNYYACPNGTVASRGVRRKS